ncbi:CopD family protein [uncultured Marinobacter sp.]|uniref:CopD family protein n=1 Tax=uncultured Marinobacter sp. TaxID=187379 RepID=UPI0030DAE285
MLLLLTLHIMALLFWVASLFYLPALLAGRHGDNHPFEEPPEPYDSLSRLVFTRIATPAAIVAILAGTLVFVVDRNASPWLLLKLTLVAMLVVAHTLLGLLVLRAEADNGKPIQPWCRVFLVVLSLLVLAILWVVLAKPSGIGALL